MAVLAVAAALTWIAISGGDAPDRETPGPSTTGSSGKETLTVAERPVAPRRIVRFTVGRGSRSAAIVRRAGTRGPRPVVIFLHGWGIVGADAYRPWIRHLAAMGNTVIVPRYQRDTRSDPGRVRAWMLSGIRRALARVEVAPGTLVVAGHSAGAALAADYAAVAPAQRLPRPIAVFAAYPGRRIRGYPGGIPQADLGRIPSATYLTALAGAADTVVGELPARELARRATRVPTARRRFVLVRDAAVADHYAPTRSGGPARRAFWRRLDRLMTRARG